MTKDKGEIAKIKADMNKYANERKEARKASKAEMDKHAMFNRAADAYITSRKLLPTFNYNLFHIILHIYC